MRRDQDSVNPTSHLDIMALAPEDDADDHPYWYARVLGIFHVVAKYTGPGTVSEEWETIDLLWVRWFRRDLSAPGGFGSQRLHRIQFFDGWDPDGYAFLDPAVVVRAVHLIPAFAHRPRELYYVNM